MKNNRLSFALFFILLCGCSLRAYAALNSSPESIENLKKINTVNLLLPLLLENLDSRTIQYTLRGYNGCYEWFSSQPSVLAVKGFDEKDSVCHSQALVSLATNKPYNNIVWISAKDRETNDLFKCESRVAKVTRIEIMTKLRTIDVGNIETLEVLGYDAEGNVFSSLEGMRFEWTIPQSESSNLEFVSIKDSAIKTTELRRKLENTNFQTDIIVVRGLKTGQAQVSVKVKERDYGEIKHSVTLYVIEHFIIYPDTEVYVLPFSTVQFSLALIKSDSKNTKLTPVALPSKNHVWINHNKERAAVGSDGIVDCLGKLGQVHIQVRDDQTVNNTVENYVHIVAPYSIDIQITEFTESSWEDNRVENAWNKGADKETRFDNVWNLIKEKDYYIRAFLYDDKMNKIHITQNVKIKFEFDNAFVQIVDPRNHEIRVRPTKLTDLSKLKVSLVEVVSSKGTYKPEARIEAQKDFKIISKISIVRPDKSIHLPLLEGDSKTQQQTFKLHAIGGSKRYEWVSRDLNIATIGHEAAIFPKKVGTTVIEVRDILNSKNADQIEVEVSEIRELEFLEKMKEIIVAETGNVSFFAIGGRERRRYSNCSSLQITPAVENANLVSRVHEELSYEDYLGFLEGLYNGNEHYKRLLQSHRNDEYLNIALYESYIKTQDITEVDLRRIMRLYRNYGMCSRIIFKGEFKGETSVSALYEDRGFPYRAVSLEELRLRVYDKFVNVEPIITYRSRHAEEEVILTLGSSFNWELEGGPIKWEDHRKLNTELKTIPLSESKSDILSIKSLPSLKAKKSYSVTCSSSASLDNGNLIYGLRIISHNDADYRLPDPVRLETEIRVSCRNPSSMEIYILREEDKRLDVNTVQRAIGETFTIRNEQYYNFQVWVYDEHKRPFYNFSSLKINWELDPATAGRLDSVKFPASEKVLSLSEDQYSRLYLTAIEGEVLLKAKSDGYDARLNIPRTFPKISDDVSITIKGDIELSPPQYVLYNHPENSFEISITRGSGDFAVSINDTSIAKINYNRQTQTITVTPLKLGYAEVIVQDRKLVSSKKATCRVIVAGADRIELLTDTHILEENHQADLTVNVYELNNHKFAPADLRFMNIQLSLDTDNEYQKRNALRIGAHNLENSKFNVEGRMTGDYRLVASATVTEHNKQGVLETKKIVSNAVDLHVFPSLTPNPSRLVLAPGCVTAIEIQGGPSEKAKVLNGVELVSRVSQREIIHVDQQDSKFFSIKGSRIGHLEMTFEIVYANTGRVISQVVVPVKVAIVDSVEILGMIDRKIHVGAQARLIAMLKAEGEYFRSTICPFQLQWTSKHENVLQIFTPSTTHIPCEDIAPPGQEKTFQLEKYDLAVNATAVSAGLAEIELILKTKYEEKSYNAANLQASVKIRVINPLSIEVPTYIGNPGYAGAPTWSAAGVCTPVPPAHPALLVLPPNTDYQIRPNFATDRKLRYSIFSPLGSTKVSLSETGLLTTYSEKGKVSILVEDTEVEAEILIIDILITNVYSIFVENSYKIVTLPVDADSDLKIHLQDSLGRAFPSPKELDRLKLSVFISNHKVLDGGLIEKNSLLRIRAKSEGLALVTVYLTDNPSVFDIFYVMVGSIITPASPVQIHLGGNIEFVVTSTAVSNDPKNRWYSEDPSIVDVNPSTGVASALKSGKTNIHFSNTIQYVSKVNVFSIDKIILDTPTFKISNIETNGAHYRKEYEIPFRVFSEDHEVKTLKSDSSNLNNNLDFHCTVSPPNWMSVSSKIVQRDNKQTPVCILRQMTDFPSDTNIPSSLVVTPSFTSRNKQVHFTYQQQFTFDFIGGFRVLEPTKKQITLNKNIHSASIKIQTDEPDLEVNSPALQSYLSRSYSNGVLTVTVNIPAHIKEVISSEIYITSFVTNQRDSIFVYYNQGAYVDTRTNPLSGWNLNLVDIVLILIVAVVILSLVFSMKNYPNKAGITPQRPPMQVRAYPGRGQEYGGTSYFGTNFSGTAASDTPIRSGGINSSNSDLGVSRRSYSGFQGY